MDNKPKTAKGQLSELADFIFELKRVAELQGHEFSEADATIISACWDLLDDPAERAAVFRSRGHGRNAPPQTAEKTEDQRGIAEGDRLRGIAPLVRPDI